VRVPDPPRGRRFFGVAESETLEALLAESAADQQEVTDQLGWQVRRAVEVLVAALDRPTATREVPCWGASRRRASTRRR
jgi:hypothetical protein